MSSSLLFHLEISQAVSKYRLYSLFLFGGDNSVHLHECSPFWVGIFIIIVKKTTMFDIDMYILIGKALKHFHIVYEIPILC